MTPVYDVTVEPRSGDGRLAVGDVEAALRHVPHGADVCVRIGECDYFEPDVPGRLARGLAGSPVVLHFGSRAHRIAADFTALYELAAAEYLAVEAGYLGRGA